MSREPATLTRTLSDGTTVDPRSELELTSSLRDVSIVFWSRVGIETVELAPGDRIVIGRSEPADVRLRDRSLSRLHAELRNEDGMVFVRDLESRNGTLLHGRRIVGETEVRLGDELRLGTVVAQIKVKPRRAGVHGIDALDQFLSRLEEELVRAGLFGRSLSLLMFHSPSGEIADGRNWRASMRQALRPVDRMATYGTSSALVLLPEMGLARARAVATSLIHEVKPGDLVCALAARPESGTTHDELLAAVHKLSRKATAAEPLLVADPQAGVSVRDEDEPEVVVESPKMKSLHELVNRAARIDAAVLVLGETGVGKELIATALHRRGPRCEQPLCIVNCAALPATLIESLLFGHERGAYTGADRRTQGVFEEADGGTVFLDEIGELSNSAQAVLLRILETKRFTRLGSTQEIAVNVRVVAATNRDIEKMVAASQFRPDLYYRLNALTLEVPPLRERPEEIAIFCEMFLLRASRAWGAPMKRIHRDALEALQKYPWPGNVRELRNAVEQAVILGNGEELLFHHLPENVRTPAARALFHPSADAKPKSGDLPAYRERIKSFEAAVLREALREHGGNRTEAAKALQIPLRTLMSKLKALRIKD